LLFSFPFALDPQQIESPKFFGGTAFVHPKAGDKIGRMVRFVITDVAAYTPDEKAQMEKIIAALSAEAGLRSPKASDNRDAAMIAEGRKLIGDDALTCLDCHQFHTDDPVRGPLLTGYGSRDWLLDFLKNPAHEHFYGRHNDRMPSFGKSSRLSARELELLVAWMRGE
jgi:ubiquinol-cytochrome c reductase cytochrome b subunit